MYSGMKGRKACLQPTRAAGKPLLLSTQVPINGSPVMIAWVNSSISGYIRAELHFSVKWVA